MDRRELLKNSGLLVGGSILAPSLLSLLQSCQSQPRLSWEPKALSNDEAAFLGALVDTLLPKTDTPGALDVKVDIFLDAVYANLYEEENRKNTKKEISDLAKKCKSETGKEFVDLDAEAKKTFVKKLETEGAKYVRAVWGKAVSKQEPVSFYRGLKSSIIWAYCSSEEIGKKVLNYDPIPGPYKGCIPLSDAGGKVWSL